MPDYKTIRLKQRVYDDLAKRQRPRESMSQVIERILEWYDEAAGMAHRLSQTLKGGEAWTTKQ